VTGDPLGVVPLAEDLFRRAVMASARIDDRTLEDWMTDASTTAGAPPSRGAARAIRRCARNARKLAAYWADHDPGPLVDWRNGVDEALGSRGWEPLLELARTALDEDPSPDGFEEVKRLHRATHFTPWMEGISFAEWEEAEGG
jgi:hypothetical protein